MEFERISDHIFRMELDFQPVAPIRFPVALWLVQGEQGWTLIDSGPPDSSDIIVSAIARATAIASSSAPKSANFMADSHQSCRIWKPPSILIRSPVQNGKLPETNADTARATSSGCPQR